MLANFAMKPFVVVIALFIYIFILNSWKDLTLILLHKGQSCIIITGFAILGSFWGCCPHGLKENCCSTFYYYCIFYGQIKSHSVTWWKSLVKFMDIHDHEGSYRCTVYKLPSVSLLGTTTTAQANEIQL